VEIALLIALSWWGLRVIARRADERDQAEDALRSANRRKDVFLATLAHELRNPLAPVVTCARLLKRADGPEASSEWAVDVIDRQVRHMARLLDDLLDASRVTHDRLELRLSRIDLHAPLGAAIEAVRPAMDGAGHHLDLDLHPGGLGVSGDPDRLTQIFSNVLHNAMKYTPAGGRIRVRTGIEGRDAVVVISDDGEGIAAAALPQVFEMFVQGHVAGERAQGGLGIGLALVRALVSLHGGRVEAHSDGPGRGSAFTIRLPLT
jgi:signal transduction histidine kinase